MNAIEKLPPEVMLTDLAGAETLLQVKLPLVIVDDREIYKFTDTPSGEASGVVIAELVSLETHHLGKDTIKSLGVKHMNSLARTAGNINKKILPLAGFKPLEIIKDEVTFYGFAGLRLQPVEISTPPNLLIKRDENNEFIPTPLENRLLKSGVDITGMTLIEKRVVDSLITRADTHLNIEAITELLSVDHNVNTDTENVAKTLVCLLARSKAGHLPKIQFRVIKGDLRVQWQGFAAQEEKTISSISL